MHRMIDEAADPAFDVADGAVPSLEPEAGRPPDAEAFEFDVAVEALYHRARAAWFDRAHRWAMFCGIMGGSAAAAGIVDVTTCGMLVAAVCALDLVFDVTGRAGAHRDIARDHLSVVAELHLWQFSPEACRKAEGDQFRIAASAPAPFNALHDLAHNEAVRTLGRDDVARVSVGWRRWMLANVWRFEPV